MGKIILDMWGVLAGRRKWFSCPTPTLQITGHTTLNCLYHVNIIPQSGPEFRGTSQNRSMF